MVPAGFPPADFMTPKRFRLALCVALSAACLPQVGPPVGAGGGGTVGTTGGGAGGSGGGGTPTAGGGSATGGSAAGGGVTDPGCPGFANCVTFVDATAPGDARQIVFPNGS